MAEAAYHARKAAWLSHQVHEGERSWARCWAVSPVGEVVDYERSAEAEAAYRERKAALLSIQDEVSLTPQGLQLDRAAARAAMGLPSLDPNEVVEIERKREGP